MLLLLLLKKGFSLGANGVRVVTAKIEISLKALTSFHDIHGDRHMGQLVCPLFAHHVCRHDE